MEMYVLKLSLEILGIKGIGRNKNGFKVITRRYKPGETYKHRKDSLLKMDSFKGHCLKYIMHLDRILEVNISSYLAEHVV